MGGEPAVFIVGRESSAMAYTDSMKRWIFFLLIAFEIIIVVILAVNATVQLESAPYIYNGDNGVASVPGAEVVVIPGAAVLWNGDLSPILQDRADTAIALYHAEKVSKILVSGDNSTLSHNEVTPVDNYLLANGIPPQDIFLDHAGFDTYSTMYRARAIFGVTSMLIASQSFHLPRAVFIARSLGLTAYGVTASNDHANIWNYIREVGADEKAVLDLLLHRQPEYLGTPVPITGNGNQ
jgi:SanA protein